MTNFLEELGLEQEKYILCNNNILGITQLFVQDLGILMWRILDSCFIGDEVIIDCKNPYQCKWIRYDEKTIAYAKTWSNYEDQNCLNMREHLWTWRWRWNFLARTWWDGEALRMADEVFQSFKDNLEIYSFKTILNSIIEVCKKSSQASICPHNIWGKNWQKSLQ